MSMNLAFYIKGYQIDFPVQTPTTLTYAVMDEPDKQKRLQLIRDYLISCKWTKDDIDRVIEEIQEVLKNPKVELTYI